MSDIDFFTHLFLVKKNNRYTCLISVVQIKHNWQQVELQITAAPKVALLQVATVPGLAFLIIEPQQQ